VAKQVVSPLDVFTRLHHEINHPLLTLWFHVAGDRGNWLGYRVPSLIAGVATVPLAGVIGRRRGAAAAFAAMAVVGASYVLVLYASEARGYALCVFFAFLCFDLLERHHLSGGWRSGAGYALAALPGLAAHVIFASVVLAGLAWTLEHGIRGGLAPRQLARRTALCHALPLVALAALYLVDIRHIAIGGGASNPSFIDSYGSALAWSLGTPFAASWQLLFCIAAVLVLVAGLRRVGRDPSDPRAFFAGAIVVFPVSLALLRGSEMLYARHFLVSMAFLVLLLAFVLAALWRRGARAAAALALAAYLVANGVHLAALLKHGRGMPSEALLWMSERTRQPLVTVGSDHDFRIGTSLEFHARSLAGAKPLDYDPQDSWPRLGPEWLITHVEPLEPPVPDERVLQDGAGNRYELDAIFPAAPLSGLHWFVYHNLAVPR
jgi:hypothetical protein